MSADDATQDVTSATSDVWGKHVPAPGTPEGFTVRTTYPTNPDGVEVMLERWQAGTEEPPHYHPGDDMTVVVEGKVAVQFYRQEAHALVPDGEGSSSTRAMPATSAPAGSTMPSTSRPAGSCTCTTGPLPSIPRMPRLAEEGRRRMSAGARLSRPPVVAVIGMATADYLYVLDDYPQADSVTPALEHRLVVGGLAGRAAIAAKRLGGATRLLAGCGTGVHAEVLKAGLDAEGVDCTWVAYDQPSQHSAVILARGDATRTIIWLPQPMADARMVERLPEFLQGVDVALLDSTDEALATAALDECEKKGVTTVIDTGSGRPWTGSLLGRVDHVIAPEKYALKATGHPAERAAVELWGGSCRAVFGVTQGPRGGVFTTGKEPECLQRWTPPRSPPWIPAAPATPFTVPTRGRWRRVCRRPSASPPPPGPRDSRSPSSATRASRRWPSWRTHARRSAPTSAPEHPRRSWAWTMGAPLAETTIVNRCGSEDTYESRPAAGTLP